MGVAWAMAFVMPLFVAAANSETGFGSYQTSVRDCKTQLDGVIRHCSSIELTQRSASALRIRFVASGAKPGSSIRLTFIAAQSLNGRRVLECRRGTCELASGPWSAKVISGSSATFDARGIPDTLPSAWPMQGICTIADRQITCESSARQGLSMRPEARI